MANVSVFSFLSSNDFILTENGINLIASVISVISDVLGLHIGYIEERRDDVKD